MRAVCEAARRACPKVSGVSAGVGMSGVRVRRCRGWVGLCLPLALFFYIVLYCNSALWTSLSINTHPLDNILTGSGFRKLLEEQGRGVSNSTTPGLAQRLPSAIIIGVRKCGTRALLEFLNLHPDIVTAEDEIHFFNDDDKYKQGLDWYRRRMPHSLSRQITIEKTPGYFISHIAPSRVHRMNSSIKLIVLLRHPTIRTVSDYTQIYFNKLYKNETLDAFEDIAIDKDTGGVNTRYKAVQISMYHQHFRHWLDVFPRHQVHVVDGDRLITDPVSEIEQIENFLGIAHRISYNILYLNSTRGFYCMRVNSTYERCLGASKGRRHPDIDEPVIRKLNRFFTPHNKQLFDLLHRRFKWT